MKIIERVNSDYAIAISTLDPQSLVDLLNTPSVRHGQDPSADELERATGFIGTRQDLVEAGDIGRLLRANLSGELETGDLLQEINEYLRSHQATLEIIDGRLAISSNGSPIIQLYLLVADMIASGIWHRVRKCLGCDCIFYDASRNGKRVWCSMEICGNRAKVGRWRSKHGAVCTCGDVCTCRRRK